jgi:hypothetical protein
MIKFDQFIAEKEACANLIAWHKDSDKSTKNSDGSPKEFYHGTATKFSEFNSDKTMDGVFWFTEDKSKLEKGGAGASSKGIIMPVYIKAKKVAGWDEYDKYSIDELIKDGYDAVKLDDDMIVFHPNQIKSINNCGKYSDSKNIFEYEI